MGTTQQHPASTHDTCQWKFRTHSRPNSDDELLPLHAALLAVRGGVRRGRTILILGPCNAGKTALWLQVHC